MTLQCEGRAEFAQELADSPDWDEGTRGWDPHDPDPQKYHDARKRGKVVKKSFNKHANRAYLDSLIYVHWQRTNNFERFLRATDIASKKNNKHEISVSIYEKGKPIYADHNFGAIGIILKGYVSLAGRSMDSMYTGRHGRVNKHNPEMKASSGVNKGVFVADKETYILDKDDYDHATDSPMSEALLDNWKAVGIIVSQKHHDRVIATIKKYEAKNSVSLNLEINIINIDGSINKP